jgi:hypothetical protein
MHVCLQPHRANSGDARGAGAEKERKGVEEGQKREKSLPAVGSAYLTT